MKNENEKMKNEKKVLVDGWIMIKERSLLQQI
jgi:hypothetical protein